MRLIPPDLGLISSLGVNCGVNVAVSTVGDAGLELLGQCLWAYMVMGALGSGVYFDFIHFRRAPLKQDSKFVFLAIQDWNGSRGKLN